MANNSSYNLEMCVYIYIYMCVCVCNVAIDMIEHNRIESSPIFLCASEITIGNVLTRELISHWASTTQHRQNNTQTAQTMPNLLAYRKRRLYPIKL